MVPGYPMIHTRRYPGTYPSMTDIISFGTRVLYVYSGFTRVPTRLWLKKLGLVPGYPTLYTRRHTVIYPSSEYDKKKTGSVPRYAPKSIHIYSNLLCKPIEPFLVPHQRHSLSARPDTQRQAERKTVFLLPPNTLEKYLVQYYKALAVVQYYKALAQKVAHIRQDHRSPLHDLPGRYFRVRYAPNQYVRMMPGGSRMPHTM